jgi:hypothetical protein
MEMVDTKLVLMLELFKFLLGSHLVVLGILGRLLHSLLYVFADKENLAVFVVKILRLNLCPRKAAKLFNDPGHVSTNRETRDSAYALFGKSRPLWKSGTRGTRSLGVLDADVETTLSAKT